MNSKQSQRRRFLKESATLAGLAAAGIRYASGQTLASESPEARSKHLYDYGKPSRFETSVGLEIDEGVLLTPLQDSVGIITPSSLHFMITHYQHYSVRHPLGTPDIDPRQHRLMIHGLVDRPLIFTLEDLKRLPSVSRIHFLECAGNSGTTTGTSFYQRHKDAETTQQTHGLTSCSEWTGVLLSVLLREAGVQKGASWLVAEGEDPVKLTMDIPLTKAMDDVLVAYGQNGEALRPEQGYPLRLVLPGWEGRFCVKWLRRIQVVDQPYLSKYESGGYSMLKPDGKTRWFQFEMGPKSVITRPSGGQQLPGRGFYEITGLAWSGGGAVRRVEVSTDGGRSWQDASLQEPVHSKAHARFRLDWNWDGEEVVLQSRCTDDLGQVQPTLAEFSELWGVDLEFWQTTTNSVNHFNVIYPWKVTRDGRVYNAMF